MTKVSASNPKRAAPDPTGRRRRATSAGSAALVTELRAELGESRLFAILSGIRDHVRPALRIRHSEEREIARMRADNATRLEVKRAAILADTVSSDEAGVFISRTRPVVNKLAKSGDLLAVNDGRYLRFPRWQFDQRTEDGLVPGLRHVLSVMDATPFRKAAWLISPNPRFDNRAPIELLREGLGDRVYEEAKTVVSG